MPNFDSYQKNIGTKFNADGSVRFFPGNTIISMMDHQSAAFAAFQHIRSMLRTCPASRCCTLLPEESIHMTVIEGVCHQWRRPELWTSMLPVDCRLSQVDDLFEERFKAVGPLGTVRMRMEQLVGESCFLIRLAPEDDMDLKELCRYRDEVSEALGIRFPNHDAYRFHVSLCYITSRPSPEEADQLHSFMEAANQYIEQTDTVFTVQQPQLTYFDNMFRFSPHRIPRGNL